MYTYFAKAMIITLIFRICCCHYPLSFSQSGHRMIIVYLVNVQSLIGKSYFNEFCMLEACYFSMRAMLPRKTLAVYFC